MTTIPSELTRVDGDLLQRAREIEALLPAARQRLALANKDPKPPASAIVQLEKSIGELERALGMIRFRPAGVQGVDIKPEPSAGTLRKARAGEVRPGHKWTR